VNDVSRDPAVRGLSARAAARIERSIIGLGLLALFLIFQPVSVTLFGFGCALVVFAGLVNNLLPLCLPGVTARALLETSLVIALSFFIVMLLAIGAAHLYGAYFANVTVADNSEPFYRQPFVWGVAATAAVLALALFASKRSRPPSPQP